MAINNPYVPGDPFSYDLKWLVRKIREHQIILDGLDERIQNAIIAALENLDQLGPKYFESAADLISSDLKDKSIAYIEGFFIPGDGGANLYYVTTDYNDIIGADFYLTLDGPNRWALPIIVTPYVTPEMFGAYGDGIEDDTDAMKVAAKYKEIVLTKSYLVKESIELQTGTNVYGGTMIDEIPESSVLFEYPGVFTMSGVSGVTIKGTSFVGPGARTDATIVNRSTVKIFQSSNVNIENCKFFGIDSGYVIRSRESDHVYITKCEVNGYSFTGIGFIQGNEDVVVTECILEGLTGTNNNTYPITLSGHEDATSVTKRAVCSRNIIKCPFPRWEAIDAHGGYDLVITDNVIEGSMTGIAVMQTLNTPELADTVVIKGNVITLSDDTSYAANVNNVGILCQVSNAVISGNIVNNGGAVTDGLGVERSCYVSGENIVVSNNVFNNSVGTIFYTVYATNVIIENNVVNNWTAQTGGTPYFILCNSGLYVDLYVRDNIAQAPATAYLSRVASDADTTGCYIKYDNNKMVGGSPLVANLSKIVCNPSTAAPVSNGRRGDIVMNAEPASGQAKGWICTATFTNGVGGAWASMGNL